MTRALRIMLVANDGFSAGHVTRAIAISRGLARVARHRGLALRTVLVTTSEADALLADEPIAIVRLPAPDRARRAGFTDPERRRIAAALVDGALEGFAPDLIVADTFPNGPHDELASVGRRAQRALVRSAVPDERALARGLDDYALAVLADDPVPVASGLAIRIARVPPITLGSPALPRAAARAALGLPAAGRAILVAAGGGGDDEAAASADAIAAAVARVAPEVVVAIARGPLDRARAGLRVAPLEPYLAAFDGAIVPAGYNTAHELAAARVPAALFARPRPFDDQAARAARFATAGFACVLDRLDDAAITAALAWMVDAPRPALAVGGADRAAEVLLDLVTA